MVPKICITGGPCGGKSSSLASITEWLSDAGYYVIIVPEAYTFLKQRGVLPIINPVDLQSLVIDVQLQLEQRANAEALKFVDQNPIIVCDRGLADGGGYCSEEVFVAALKESGITSLVAARDERYHTGVFHMVTAAKGAEQFYTTANNDARHETAEEARAQDDRTLHAWIGTPHLRIIDNSTDFPGKLLRLKQEICRALGIPVPIEIERKFVCQLIDMAAFPPEAQHINIEQAYLVSRDPQVVSRIRRRGQHGTYLHFRTEKRFVSSGVNFETEKVISTRDYNISMTFRDPTKGIVRKTRTCFVFEHQYFEFDMIPLRDGSVIPLLELELTEENQEIRLPPFINVIKEVTDDPEYTNVKIAERV
jgi:CYTH domain-containing protein/predicted ATPase